MADKINEVFSSFLADIIKVFPEYKGRLYDIYYEDEGADLIQDQLNGFLNNVNKISEQIVDNDLITFDNPF